MLNRKFLLLSAGLASAAVVVGQMNADGRKASRVADSDFQTQSSGVVGPDVIVGSLPTVQFWGQVGAMRAYSVGTTSCNIGDANLLWIAGNNQHPVIAQNMYRLHDGRFEMIGISHLKHGFTALNENLCDTCNPTPGTSLGVGCSDPYTAGLNGNQSLLGPRWQVNATTGVFAYPFSGTAIQPTIGRRLQILASDLDTANEFSGAFYYAEGHYVTQDDAAAGNHYNNASYRRVIPVTGGNIVATGATFQQQPAIMAWQSIDPEVEITTVDDSDGGRFYIGSRVYDNGDGTWDYEYAIFNYNSHQSARAFEVPMGDGVDITNIDFKDVQYHSGEPYSGADWTEIENGTTMRWETQTMAQNVNANALRWSTLYNYRFTANAAPTTGEGTLEMFRTSAELTVEVPVPGEGQEPCPSDVDNNGDVNGSDLLQLLNDWGQCDCPSDIDDNGVVNGSDLLQLLNDWGSCV